MLLATLAKLPSRLRHEIVPLASHCPTVTLINTKIKILDRLRGGEGQQLCNLVVGTASSHQGVPVHARVYNRPTSA